MINRLLQESQVHPSWVPVLEKALLTVDKAYLNSLLEEESWLPGVQNLFAAFRQDLNDLSWILFGESPYPRKESSVGIAFLDGMVKQLWSDSGLSKQVNRATSLRNIMKTMLVAEGYLDPAVTTQQAISQLDKSELVSTIDELFAHFMQEGCLMLNATPVLHPDRKPLKESKYWIEFNRVLLEEIKQVRAEAMPTVVLWGKIAQSIRAYQVVESYPVIETEHPYNISFIANPVALDFFAQLSLLRQR